MACSFKLHNGEVGTTKCLSAFSYICSSLNKWIMRLFNISNELLINKLNIIVLAKNLNFYSVQARKAELLWQTWFR